jgi:hypothetical protein
MFLSPYIFNWRIFCLGWFKFNSFSVDVSEFDLSLSDSNWKSSYLSSSSTKKYVPLSPSFAFAKKILVFLEPEPELESESFELSIMSACSSISLNYKLT